MMLVNCRLQLHKEPFILHKLHCHLPSLVKLSTHSHLTYANPNDIHFFSFVITLIRLSQHLSKINDVLDETSFCTGMGNRQVCVNFNRILLESQ
ncbi:CLUMA_CG008775, isoform A [Clunio marinus]|uniref:CLUMA_CG008775, isoform A n=1 Tax=Clunio marinus TaxID=568069 RepID=A0A1J1I4B6_9DIPT|nr:CLUMA_CG008775, isoform A [Clunio marinus]